MASNKKIILLVNNDKELNIGIGRIFSYDGYKVLASTSGSKAMRMFEVKKPAAVVLGLGLPDMDGMEALRRFKKVDERVGVVILSPSSAINRAVEALKLGALDFITEPVDFDKLKDILLQFFNSEERFSRRLPEGFSIVGDSHQIKKVWQLVDRVARSEATVLLIGETGTGKELFARIIHQLSERWKAPFVTVDCSTLPNTLMESELFGHEKGAYTGAFERKIGRLERASGGTVFLDEVSALPLEMQAKLLRFVQEREIERVGGGSPAKLNVRLLAAVNSGAELAVKEGFFREDLYYRLSEFIIRIPPLRERKGDIALLVNHFVGENKLLLGQKSKSISPEAMRILEAYHWPGNVRELRNAVSAASLLGDETIFPGNIPPDILNEASESQIDIPPEDAFSLELRMQLDLGKGLKQIVNKVKESVEKEIIAHIIDEKGLDRREIARLLKIDPKTLGYKINSYGFSDVLPSRARGVRKDNKQTDERINTATTPGAKSIRERKEYPNRI